MHSVLSLRIESGDQMLCRSLCIRVISVAIYNGEQIKTDDCGTSVALIVHVCNEHFYPVFFFEEYTGTFKHTKNSYFD